MPDRRPYGRREHARALVANALTSPLALALFVGVFAVGVIAGASLGLSLLLAALVYGIAAAQVLFDEDAANRVLERARKDSSARPQRRESLPLDDLAPEIRARVEAVREREARIRKAIEGGGLPYDEVVVEVDSFVSEAERSARSAQLDVAERIEAQLAGYHAEMERLCVELDTVRAHLLSTSVTTDSANQRLLSLQVRGLREEMGAVATGIEQAYDEAPI